MTNFLLCLFGAITAAATAMSCFYEFLDRSPKLQPRIDPIDHDRDFQLTINGKGGKSDVVFNRISVTGFKIAYPKFSQGRHAHLPDDCFSESVSGCFVCPTEEPFCFTFFIRAEASEINTDSLCISFESKSIFRSTKRIIRVR